MGYIMKLREKLGHDEIIGVGAGIFLYQGRRVLLQKRKDNGCWSMHSGALEIGETLEENALRELYEETGLTANKLEFLGTFSGEDMRYVYPNGDKVCIVQIMYVCDDFSGEMRLQPEETTMLAWFDIDELPENINPPDKKAFAAFKAYMEQKK